MHSPGSLTGPFEPIFVARQPIFDRQRRIWGYELLFRHSDTAATAEILDPDLATAKVIADGLTLAATGLPTDKHLLINFPQGLLLNGSTYALPQQRCVIEILETVPPEPAIIEALKAVKAAGYTLALDDFVGQAGCEPFLELADIVKVEVSGQSRADLARLTATLQQGRAQLLAEKVETQGDFSFLHGLGYQLFQGYFFSKPEIVPGRKVSSAGLAKLRVLRELGREECDLPRLAKVISTDVSLSYRLLNYLNSAAFGLRQTVTSIQQAVAMLGLRRARQWLMVILLCDLNPAPAATELARESIHRARFLQLLSEQEGAPQTTGEQHFLLGLLSKLDALLGQSMPEVVGLMPLDEQVKKALLGQPTPLLGRLQLVAALEAGHWPQVMALLDRYRIGRDRAARLWVEAGAWSGELTHASQT